MSFHVVVLEEALLRHAKARDIFHCLGVYPETKTPGSRKRVVCYSILFCNVSRVMELNEINAPGNRKDSYCKAVPFHSLLPTKLDDSSVRFRLAARVCYADVRLSKRDL